MEKTGAGTEEMKIVEAAQDLVSQNLDKVEAQIDSTVDNAKNVVHELRSEAQEVADRTLIRFKGFWGRMQEKAEAQMAERPWVVLGTLLVVGYLLTRSRSRPNRY
ncbi:MAG TPA: hypothetical protein VJV04_17085 [Nitrospiraceae bacterium]|nr:hypothetical protein [Nitrospiraceae bacterium]